jgi:hypothetical protein
MRDQLSNDFTNTLLDEPSSADVRFPPPAAQEQPVETSLVDLSAILIVILTAIAVTFAGAIIAISWY